MITVLEPGLLTTIQDQGRPGLRAFGMPVGGALDSRAFALANLLAGNAPGAAAVDRAPSRGGLLFGGYRPPGPLEPLTPGTAPC